MQISIQIIFFSKYILKSLKVTFVPCFITLFNCSYRENISRKDICTQLDLSLLLATIL